MSVAAGILCILIGPALVTPWYERVAVVLFGLLCLLMGATEPA